MYLIDSNTLALKRFPSSRPRYAILSHTWGPEEVSFAEFQSPSKGDGLAGFQKIQWTCAQARQDGLGYVWVDTCCINKESSAELGEAVNSMFQWYSEAVICYAYMEDLSGDVALPIREASVLQGCRWFSRGWTLQELIAPREIDFFGATWNKIGRKGELTIILEKITRIPQKVLSLQTPLQDISVADRMSWAAGRETSREEDIAYCLMGIFDVNMPMVYGERNKAFLRLQDEIVKQTQDDSLFAWRASERSARDFPCRGLFASSPSEFASDVSITPFRTSRPGLTNVVGGGRVSLSCTVYKHDSKTVLGLKCFRGTDLSKRVGIEVLSTEAESFLRARPSELILHSHNYYAPLEDVIMERFTERREAPPINDIYRDNAVQLSALPAEMSVVRIHPKTFPGSEDARVIPLIYLIDQRFAFELQVDDQASGITQFKQLGWNEKLGISKGSSMRVLVQVWVKLGLAPGSYQYFLTLQKLAAEVTTTRFLKTNSPTTAVLEQEIEVGWATIEARGSHQNVDGHEMFSINLRFAVREEVMAQAKYEQIIQEQQREQEKAANTRFKLKKAKKAVGVRLVACATLTAATTCMLYFGFRLGGRRKSALVFTGCFLFGWSCYLFIRSCFILTRL